MDRDILIGGRLWHIGLSGKRKKEKAVGLVTNFSNEGIQIHSVHAFSKGDTLTIRIDVDEMLAGTDHISMVVKNVWCRSSRVESLYHAGFKIIDISERAKINLQNLMETFSYLVPYQQTRPKKSK